MNLLDWDAIRAIQRNMHSNHINNSMEHSSRTATEGDPHCEYPRHTVDEAQSPSSHNFYINESEVADPDGEPLEMDREDPELARKQKELREIEERIMLKKAAIALKTVELKTTPADFSCNEQSAKCKGATLKDRVHVILQQRHPDSFLSKVWSPKERMNSSRLSKDGLLQNEHPLKLRVKALMKQRCGGPCVLPGSREVPDVTPPPPSQSVASPAKEENSVNKGFQRFLSVLNKGVDMDFLSRIVNDDSEDLPSGEDLLNIQPPVVENKSDPCFRSKSQDQNSGASLLGRSQTNSGERKTDQASKERYLKDRLCLPDDDDEEEKKNDRGDCCSGSRGRSKSPLAVKKKEEEKPEVDEQREQLQNILKTLGLNMEVEEMSKLSDRTQERLYGKKHKDTSAKSRRQQESRQSGSQRHNSNSSSSSSRSTRSRSPSRHQCSHSKDSKQRSEGPRSRDRSRDGLTRHDDNQDSKEACKDNDGQDSEEMYTYQHPYSQNQTYPHPPPAAFPDYSLSQDSQYTAYDSGTYWALTQSGIPPSLYPDGDPYPVNAYHEFPGSVGAPDMVYPHHDSPNINFFVNPDLSKSEGQTGYVSAPRCLQVISTKTPAPDRCLMTLTKSQKKKWGNCKIAKKRQNLFWKKYKEFRKQQKTNHLEISDEDGGATAPK
ncbi:uncharacterized protein LOC115007228 isoform X2 [Cottoperca gobio]|uniref:Uncharacterized protein LOC115007228 isoform X2 n=1 Tax=Cottoperca gobio TaxID=56716 RepID=A0A6J2PLY7_COTGO|nr:uncharacterized protein LOC115007228 isoform X2 [Cottoperca gobio]